VGIGDSYMTAQDSTGQGFMDVYATLLKQRTGKTIELTYLADNQNTTTRVLQNLRHSSASNVDYITPISKADIIILSVGGNDSDPFGVYSKGTCSTAQALSDCLAAYSPNFSSNYDAIFNEVAKIRDGKPTTIRATSMDNPFVGWSESPTPTFGVDFFAQVADAETAAICAAATAHAAKCVDYLHIFGGADGKSDTAKYLNTDHSHPGDLGIQVIASELLKSGTDELTG
jgi:lysophospholipase L1-like esterase